MTPEELKERLAGPRPPRLLDVRQPEEHAFAALPNSRLVPLDELPGRVEELAEWRAEEVVVYCHHGIRSINAAVLLERHGFTAMSMRGGIDAWSLRIDPSLPRYG